MTDTREHPAAIPAPEPELTAADMLARADALIPMLRDQQDDAEERGYYSPTVHEEFVRAGFSRILQPRRFGGYEFGLGTFLQTMTKIATGDPGTGWCLTLGSSHALPVGAYFPAQVQAEVFGPDGDFRSPHPIGPVGQAQRIDGGYRVSGKARYASGIPYATWALCNALVVSGDQPTPSNIVMIVPRRDLTMQDDWGSVHGTLLGMNSSGSNSFVLEDVFVPEERAMSFDWMGEPRTTTPGLELHGNPMYLGRVTAPYHATLVVPMIGAARAALDEFRRVAATGMTTFPPMVPRYMFHDDQRAFGMATAMTDAAETILYGFADQWTQAVERTAAGNEPVGVEQDARWWAMLQQAGGLAASAVETLAHRASSSNTGKGTKLGRYFRDVTMYRQHISSQQIDHAVRNAAFYLGATDSWMVVEPRS